MRKRTAISRTPSQWNGSTARGRTAAARTTATTLPPIAMVHSRRAADDSQLGAGGTAG